MQANTALDGKCTEEEMRGAGLAEFSTRGLINVKGRALPAPWAGE